jgi:hypothetical protein
VTAFDILLDEFAAASSGPILVSVWTHLASWLVKSGEVPQLEIGDTFGQVAVRASCWSVTDAGGPDAMGELVGADPSGDQSFHYAITGAVEWRREPSTMLLRSGPLAFLAEPREMSPAGEDEPLAPARHNGGFRLSAVGDRVTVVAGLDVVAAYETEAFDYPDVRRDWVVRGLKVEHRELVASPEFPDSREPGRILHVDDIPRMLRWADASGRDHATYLLDLEPLP